MEHVIVTFRADLPADDDGLVLDYPGFWSRVRAPQAASPYAPSR